MSSTTRANRPTRDKSYKSQTSDQNSTPESSQGSATKNQATAEQMRLAQMITTEANKGEDPAIKAKIQQVIELTGRSEDEALFALHDVNYDLNIAVEKLLESADTQQNEWQAISKKKKSQQAAKPEPVVNSHKSEGKREKSKDRDAERPDKQEQRSSNRRDRGPPRFQRGRGRERGTSDNDNNERNKSEGGPDRSYDRGERGGRGRGRGGAPSRGRGRGRGGFTRPARFNNTENKERGPHIDTWTNEQAQPEKENIGSWGDMTEDWSADDWQGSLEESKVFTPSVSNDFTGTSAPSLDNSDSKLYSPQSLETQVFTATSLQNSLNDSTSYHSPLQTGSLGQQAIGHGAAIGQNAIGQNAIGQNSIGQNAIGTNSLGSNSLGQNSIGQRLDLGTLFPKAVESSSPAPSPYTSSPAPSQYMSQYAKEATESIKNAVGIGSPAAGQQSPIVMSQSSDRGLPSAPSANQQRAKPQRSKLPPPSKIPASAVEMPGGMPQRNYQLDVQFGTLEFPSSLPEAKNSVGFGAPISSSVGAGAAPGSVANCYASATVSVSPPKAVQPNSGGMSPLDSLAQSVSQSPRGPSTGVFSAQNNTTPPKDYSQNNLQQSNTISSPPDNLSYQNSQDRKSSPYSGSRASQGAGSGKPSSSPLNYNSQSQYSSGYQSGSYKPSGHTATTTSYGAHNGGLASGLSSGLSGQASYSASDNNRYQGYTQAQYPASQTGSLYQNSSSYTSQTQSSSYTSPPQSSSSSSSGYTNQQQSAYTSQPSAYSNSTTTAYTAASSSSASYSAQTYPSATTCASYPSQGYQSSQGYSSQGYNSRSDNQSYPATGTSQSQSYPAQYQNSTSSYQSSSSQSSYPSSVSTQSYSQSGTYSSSQSAGYSGYTSSSAAAAGATKLADSLGKIGLKEEPYEGSSTSSAALTTTTSTTASSLASGSVAVSAASLGGTANHASTNSSVAGSKTASSALPGPTTKAPPNLPPGVPLIQNYMPIGQPGITPFAFASLAAGQQHIYSYEDLQLLQQRIPMNNGHFGATYLDEPATSLPGRDQNAALASVPYSSAGTDSKLTRVEAQSPVNPQTTTQPPAAPSATHQQQQAFINPTAALPPGYNYYYPQLPSGYSYPPTMFPVPSVTNAAHGISTASIPFQKPGGYGSHNYGTAGQSADFSKTYTGVSTAPNKGSSGSMVSSSSGSDLTGTGSNYSKTHTQSFDKAGFHGGTPPPFNMPLPTGTQAGPMGAPTAYGAQYVPVMAHQPHSQMMHPHLQDSTGGSARATQPLSSQTKPAGNKSYSNYWGAN